MSFEKQNPFLEKEKKIRAIEEEKKVDECWEWQVTWSNSLGIKKMTKSKKINKC